MSTKRYTLTSGWLTSASIRAWLTFTHPSGMARPCRKMWTGTSNAATTPPAEKRLHQRGSIVLPGDMASAPHEQPVQDEQRGHDPGDVVTGDHHRGRHLAVAHSHHL